MKRIATMFGAVAASAACVMAAPTFTVDVGHPSGKVSPLLYGLMTEEINHSYDGGLYAELIQNRAFMDDPTKPVNWSVTDDNDSAASITLDLANGLNDQLTNSLRLTVTKASQEHRAGVANGGYWGIPVHSKTTYHASIFAKAAADFSGPITISIVSDDGKKVYAKKNFSGLTSDWKEYKITLETGKVEPTDKAYFAITLDKKGTIWLGFVSLFPPTWNNQPNGFRKDLMQMLIDLNPKFLRFPGGNYVEGDTVKNRFDWKKTLGPIQERRGHPCPWGYRSSDGMGLLEFLQWCEDMDAEPVLAVYAGYSLKGDHIDPGADLEPYVQDALDEIEYVTGDTNTTWGARRAKDGHPVPFKLQYVEIGNEDWFDKSGSYDGRFAQFYDAIKAKYPQLKLISTVGNEQAKDKHVQSRQPDMLDEHYYRSVDTFLHMSPSYATNYSRSGPEIFVGEWAAHETSFPPWNKLSRQEPPTPDLWAAIGDAVFMTAMERNSDIIKMQCYAPLFVNVNPGARQWRPDLIGYNALSAYGSPSYYAIRMFSRNLGDEILPVSWSDTHVQGSATLDGKTGELFLKMINPESVSETIHVDIRGAASLDSKGKVITMSGSRQDTNTISHPKNVVPVITTIHHIKPQFDYQLPANSVVVLRLKAAL